MYGQYELRGPHARSLEKWIDSDHLPRAILTDRCRVLWANAAARDAFASGNSLSLHEGTLVCAEPAGTAALARFVADCDHHVRGFFLADDGEQAFLVLRGRVIEDDNGRRTIGLVFYEDSADFLCRYMDVEVAFRLTATEHQVVSHLLGGDTAEDITRKLNVSMATTRSHIRNIYRKLNVASREALFKRLQPFRL